MSIWCYPLRLEANRLEPCLEGTGTFQGVVAAGHNLTVNPIFNHDVNRDRTSNLFAGRLELEGLDRPALLFRQCFAQHDGRIPQSLGTYTTKRLGQRKLSARGPSITDG